MLGGRGWCPRFEEGGEGGAVQPPRKGLRDRRAGTREAGDSSGHCGNECRCLGTSRETADGGRY